MRKLEELRFTEEHEWVRLDDDIAIFGITDHAQDALGDIVYVELPEIGEVVDQGDEFGVIESVKTTSELYSPLGGTVTDINEGLADNPATVNQDPYGEGWLIKVKVKDASEIDKLMTLAEYETFLAEEDDSH